MKKKITVKSLAEKISKGEDTSSAEEIEFYGNNKTEIENELAEIKSRQEPAPEVKIPAAAAQTATPTDFNPLKKPVNEKSYAGGGAGAGQVPGHEQQDIPEPTYTPPAPEPGSVPSSSSQSEKKEEEKKPKPAFNPDMDGASPKDKTEGAAVMASMLLDTWAKGYKALNQVFKISDSKINDMQAKGLIDTRVEVPYKMDWAPLMKVLADYNEDAADLLVLEPEFVTEVHPLITEELAKAGHGMSNRQKLVYLLAMKLGADGIKVYQFLSLKSNYLKFAKEQTELFYRTGKKPVHTTEPAPEKQTSRPQPEQQQNVVHDTPPDGGDQPSEDIVIEEPVHTTLQDQALSKHIPIVKEGSSSLPNFGTKKSLKRVEQAVKNDTKQSKQEVKKSAQQRIDDAKRNLASDPPPDGKKRKPGRPPGAKNKNKKR